MEKKEEPVAAANGKGIKEKKKEEKKKKNPKNKEDR
jgi:hypothetical protein